MPVLDGMFWIAFLVVLVLHALIHFLGFIHSFGIVRLEAFGNAISRRGGILWAWAGLGFLLLAILPEHAHVWYWVGAGSILLSQILIVTHWRIARFGTLVNLVLALGLILSHQKIRFENRFLADVDSIRKEMPADRSPVLREEDIAHLPVPVRAYIRRSGFLGKPIPREVCIEFEGRMREKGKDWFPFHSVQYNFQNPTARLFFMKGVLFGIQVPGYHAFSTGKATMEIKPFGLIPVVDLKGAILDTSETVTYFNDLCCFVPAWLAHPGIQWQSLDSLRARAFFTEGGIRISAILRFNPKGELIDFLSEDRYAVSENRRLPFSTPLARYRNFSGHSVASFGEAVWHYPDGKFTYGEFNLRSISFR